MSFSRAQRWVNVPQTWPIAVVLVACFGPYLAFGLRTEQVAVYALAGPACKRLIHCRPPGPLIFAGLAWLSLAAVAAIVGLRPPSGADSNYIAGLDNLLLPMAAAVLAIDWVHRWTPQNLLLTMARWYTALLAVNTLLVVASMTVGVGWLAYFWTADLGLATADSAALVGRFSGVFNQPIESGIAYSLGLLLLAYRTHHGRPWSLAPLWALLLIGGIASVSKVFILLGLPVGVCYLLYVQRAKRGQVAPVVAAVVTGAWLSLSGTVGWEGASRATSLLTGRTDADALWLYSAGRYGDGGSLREVADFVLHTSPLVGFGASGLPAPYDSSYMEAFVLGGFVGLGCYLLMLTALMVRLSQVRLDQERKALALGILAVTAMAGLGGPTFTANRAGIPLTLGVVILLMGRGGLPGRSLRSA